ncbi:hypothetical protein VNO80_15616 [Phaseolus coccineus]|uniref:Uncharacterized protein n=1 Tax=Phaseolus coccineus TaxID=3886 RepID=A0AAN9R2G4_PHACN
MLWLSSQAVQELWEHCDCVNVEKEEKRMREKRKNDGGWKVEEREKRKKIIALDCNSIVYYYLSFETEAFAGYVQT